MAALDCVIPVLKIFLNRCCANASSNHWRNGKVTAGRGRNSCSENKITAVVEYLVGIDYAI